MGSALGGSSMFSVRLAAGLCGLAVLSSSAVAQSNVRPVARVAIPWASFAATGPAPVDPLARHARLAAESDAPADDLLVELDFAGRYQPSADIDGGGELATQRASWSATFAREIAGERVLALSLMSEATFFDFGGAGALVPGSDDPFNDLYRTGLGSTLYAPWTERTSLFGGVELALAGEDTADLGKSLILAGATGVACDVSDALSVTLGIGASQRLEDDAWVIPFLGLDWQFAERWRLAAEGERVDLAFQATDAVELAVHAAYDQRQYRLNDSNPLPGGAFRDEQIDLGAAIAWRPTSGVELRLGGGITPWRELTFIEDGGAATERELSDGVFAELALRIEL